MSAPVVLVTGASRGLGRGIAIELAKAGCSVAINFAGNKAAADECAQLCAAVQSNDQQVFFPVQADISKTDDRNNMVAAVLDHFGHLDALINNAGIAPTERADITEASEASFEKLISTNLQGPYFLTQKVANYWLQDKPEPRLSAGFKVIFVTSISAYTASINRGDYCISKAGASMAVQLWSARLAPEGIPVYEIRPGIMKTDMTSGVTSKYDDLIANGLVPQERWGTGEDIGLAARSLIEGDFPFSSGTVIDVDGGFQLRRL
ncbi:MAG: 3-ketoacyl-ACP reductase [Planctomycetes bacterium]|nr:3-ketoacyl-ACP reductase [Planctomycetota bacterium]